MAVKVLIKRHFKEGKSARGLALLAELRSQALNQAGYISGETLINHYDKRSITVISSWRSIEEWIAWEESDGRAAVEAKLDALLEGKATFEIYDVGQPQND
jgi:heme-degrading monooxygenase HmoA